MGRSARDRLSIDATTVIDVTFSAGGYPSAFTLARVLERAARWIRQEPNPHPLRVTTHYNDTSNVWHVTLTVDTRYGRYTLEEAPMEGSETGIYQYREVAPRCYEVVDRTTNCSIGFVSRDGPGGRWAWGRDDSASKGYEFDRRSEATAALADVARAEDGDAGD